MRALFVMRAEDPAHLLQAVTSFQEHCTKPGILIVDGIGPTLQELRSGNSQHKQGRMRNHMSRIHQSLQHMAVLARAECRFMHAGQALTLSIARGIKSAARRTGCAVIVTNSVDGSYRPLGGQAWSRQAHYTALLSRASSNVTDALHTLNCTVQLEAATFRPEGTPSMLPFTIGTEGAYSHEPG